MKKLLFKGYLYIVAEAIRQMKKYDWEWKKVAKVKGEAKDFGNKMNFLLISQFCENEAAKTPSLGNMRLG